MIWLWNKEKGVFRARCLHCDQRCRICHFVDYSIGVKNYHYECPFQKHVNLQAFACKNFFPRKSFKVYDEQYQLKLF